ncbi:hypothetical protein B0J11DRAFT_407372 [Neofusicoccum parvum]|nr:hypothetical protein B0J11DRAFT_407372 [Neofusicoccum parvum]
MASTGHRLEILSADDIAARPRLVHSLFELINTEFAGRPGFPVPRFAQDSDVVANLRDGGLCAVLFDARDEPIATASTKPWPEIPSSDTDFEISAVVASATHRGQGLADRCVKAVERATVAREARERAGRPLTLWIKTVEHHNRAYWTRRGFCEAGTRVGPVGMWGAEKEFVLLTMRRPAVAGVEA